MGLDNRQLEALRREIKRRITVCEKHRKELDDKAPAIGGAINAYNNMLRLLSEYAEREGQ